MQLELQLGPLECRVCRIQLPSPDLVNRSLASDDSEQCRQMGTGNSPWPTWASGWRQNCHRDLDVWEPGAKFGSGSADGGKTATEASVCRIQCHNSVFLLFGFLL
ncbi:heparan-alpha-glucosaminideN-acetyltransferase-like protein [Cricetulus griseus]|uniref:Heparan-alpha-glucosaminideN-acetyltransferase-like protein n=1 Tax=Cricetulus griseus TaxID=10029 RepID=A0A061I6H0_CRIGR|nr:heparan-alpha-glucosaminideN-acetyltransferase-like protein [Cricetulus griseus]